MGVVFGGLQVVSAVNQAHKFAQVTKLARLGQQSIALAQALEDERAQTATSLSMWYGPPDKPAAVPKELPAWLTKWYGPNNAGGGTDVTKGITGLAASRFTALADGIDGSYSPSVQQAVQTVEQQVISALSGIRANALSTGSFAPSGGQLFANTDYSIAIALLFQLDDLIAQNSGDSVLTTDVASLGTLSRAKDQASQQHAILWSALTSYQLYKGLYQGPGAAAAAAPTFQALTTSVTQEAGYLTAYQGSATADQQQLLRTSAFKLPNSAMHTIEDFVTQNQDLNLSDLGYDNGAAQWDQIANTASRQFGQVETRLAQDIVDRSVSDQLGAERTAWVTGLFTAGTLLLVLIAALVVARSVVMPLRRLRAGALEVASVSLPQRVRELGESDDPATSLEIAPISVMSTDEVGQVARAFDLVHSEAVRLAGNEAMLRTSLNAMFVSLSRRSQSLIERLSRMIDTLELNEDDPDRLGSLFAMDHLITRMRRNSENLLVLAGHEGARKRTEPVALSDVVRAAASEIEQYGRVVLNVQSGIEVTGQAATDVVHLLAEIIENATMFSPRSTEVHVTGQEVVTGGVLIEVTDTGVGITEARLEQLNWRLENPPVVDVSVSRHMGLFAVSHLAARHGVRVRLRPSSPRGLTAMVWLPESVAEATTAGYGDQYRRITGRGSHQLEPAAAAAGLSLPGGTQHTQHTQPVQHMGTQHMMAASGQVSRGESPYGASRADARQMGAVPGAMEALGPPPSVAGLPPGREPQDSAQAPSGWFRPKRRSPASALAAGRPALVPDQALRPSNGGSQAGGWQAAGHGDWQPFQRAPEPTGNGTTGAGLPMRVPQAHRMPSNGWEAPETAHEARTTAVTAPQVLSAPSGPRSAESSGPRSAEMARSRLRGFQHGSRRAEAGLPREGEGAGR
jgi:signal transduction histidine kinase